MFVLFHVLLFFVTPDLGNEIHQRTLSQCRDQQEMAVRDAQKMVWAKAELQKQDALEKAALRARKEQEKVINKLTRAHGRTLKVCVACSIVTTMREIACINYCSESIHILLTSHFAELWV